MRQREFAVWIEGLLSRLPFSCSDPEYVHSRQEAIRNWITETTRAYENGEQELREAALNRLSGDDPELLVRALSCLFVVGTASDGSAVEPLTKHSNEAVRKAARTCLFEIRGRFNGLS